METQTNKGAGLKITPATEQLLLSLRSLHMASSYYYSFLYAYYGEEYADHAAKECASIFEEAQDKLEEKILTELTGWASLTEPSDEI